MYARPQPRPGRRLACRRTLRRPSCCCRWLEQVVGVVAASPSRIPGAKRHLQVDAAPPGRPTLCALPASLRPYPCLLPSFFLSLFKMSRTAKAVVVRTLQVRADSSLGIGSCAKGPARERSPAPDERRRPEASSCSSAGVMQKRVLLADTRLKHPSPAPARQDWSRIASSYGLGRGASSADPTSSREERRADEPFPSCPDLRPFLALPPPLDSLVNPDHALVLPATRALPRPPARPQRRPPPSTPSASAPPRPRSPTPSSRRRPSRRRSTLPTTARSSRTRRLSTSSRRRSASLSR